MESVRPMSGRTARPTVAIRSDRDEAVWAEEGPITLPDIRNARVRAEVRRVAREQDLQLRRLLLAAGLHVTQMHSIGYFSEVDTPWYALGD